MSAAAHLRMTYADYLRAEEQAAERHAFHDGEMYAMAGGTTVHALLATEVTRALGNALAEKPCAAVGADQRVAIDEDNATYPDALVLCPPVQRPPGDPHAVSNPTVLVEVLSPSTEVWDRTTKFALYARLASVQHYVLVAQDCWRVEHWRRMQDGAWRYTVHGAGDHVDLDAVGVRVPVDSLYAKAEAFGGPGRDARPATPPRITSASASLPTGS